MKLQEKLICISILSLLVQGCAENISIYQPTTSKHARMNIVIPHKYHSSVAILVKKESKYFTDYSLLYGKDPFNTWNHQTIHNKHVVIDADKKLEFRVSYNVSLDQYCDFRFNFTPKSGGQYWFTLDDKKEPEKNFIHTLILGPAKGVCYPILAKSVSNKFKFLKLHLENGMPWI